MGSVAYRQYVRLVMSALVPYEGFPCLTVYTTASAKLFQILMGSPQAMKRKLSRAKVLKEYYVFQC